MSRSIRATVAGVAVLALVLAACGNSSGGGGRSSGDDDEAPVTTAEDGGASERDTFEAISGVPGVSDDEITYAVVGTKAGNPLGTCILDCYVDGIEAYFAYRNSEGGIYGRELTVGTVLDDELAANQAKSLEVISAGDSFGVFQATLLAAGWGDLDQAGVPTYTWGIHATEIVDRPAIFPSLAVRCSDCTRPVVSYAARDAGATRAASLGYGISENSKDCATSTADGIELYAEATGVELAYTNENLDYGLPNGIGPEVTAMKNAGVDFISTCMDLNGMKALAQELDRQGMSDVVLLHPNTYDQEFVAENAALFEGDYVNVQFRPFEADAGRSSLGAFEEWMEETGAEPTELAMVGWINATMAFDGLLAAGPELDQASVISATNSFADYTAGGLVVPTDWSKAHTPYTQAEPDLDQRDCAALVRVEDGAFVTVTEPETPWLCWDPTVADWTEPEPTDFE